MKRLLDEDTNPTLVIAAREQLQAATSIRRLCAEVGIEVPPPSTLPASPLVALATLLLDAGRVNKAIMDRIGAETEADQH